MSNNSNDSDNDNKTDHAADRAPRSVDGPVNGPVNGMDGSGHGVLRTLSHEIRTPLNNIIGFADMMSAEMLGPMSHPTYRDYAEDIRKSGQSILNLLNDLLEDRRYEALAESEEQHTTLIDLAPDLIAICTVDGVIDTLNPAGCAMLSLDPSKARGGSLQDFVHADFLQYLDNNFAELTGEQRRVSMKLMSTDGREVDVEVGKSVV